MRKASCWAKAGSNPPVKHHVGPGHASSHDWLLLLHFTQKVASGRELFLIYRNNLAELTFLYFHAPCAGLPRTRQPR